MCILSFGHDSCSKAYLTHWFIGLKTQIKSTQINLKQQQTNLFHGISFFKLKETPKVVESCEYLNYWMCANITGCVLMLLQIQ